eukprot:gene32418-39201_t
MAKTLIKHASIWRWRSAIASDGFVLENGFVLIENGFISKVSDDVRELEAIEAGHIDQVIHAHGALLLPGLIDSHIHVGLLGESQFYIDCRNCSTIDEMVALFNDKLVELADLPFLVGYNWDQSVLGRYPTRHDLDKVKTDKPIFVWRACWHIGVCNSRALHLCGLLDHTLSVYTPLPVQGGSVDLEEETKLPSGILRERAVEPLVAALQKHKTPQQQRVFLQTGLRICSQAGLTCVQSNDEACLQVYREMQEELPLRVLLTIPHTDLPTAP